MRRVPAWFGAIRIRQGDKSGEARKRGRLTARRVDTVTEPGKYHDGGGTGLFLRVWPSGSRQWVQRITIRGKRQEIGLGSPPAVSLAAARKLALANRMARRIFAMLRDGTDYRPQPQAALC